MSATPRTFEEWRGDQSIDAYESDFARIAWNAAITAACARLAELERPLHGSEDDSYADGRCDAYYAARMELAKLKTTKETPR